MIVLDTHVWVWWVSGSPGLASPKARLLSSLQDQGLGISAISCWEVAKLVEKGRLALALPVSRWMEQALAHPGVIWLPLDQNTAVASTQRPQPFHNDPADQIIVATARLAGCQLATDDARILAYPHVTTAWQR